MIIGFAIALLSFFPGLLAAMWTGLWIIAAVAGTAMHFYNNPAELLVIGIGAVSLWVMSVANQQRLRVPRIRPGQASLSLR